ncbi:MAG: DUF2203 domain-containing protein [Phycisphaerae bacterium]|nr:DUF2203 domain-containing protein [Phycisphaerae bacterium]
MPHTHAPVVTPADASVRRWFTPQQADRALVLVRRVLADIVTLYRRLLDLQEAVEATEGAAGGSAAAAREELIDTAERLHGCLAELDEIGVELKDWDRGVVDFPCRAGGREVRLCWRRGEPSVAHWHDVHPDSGTYGRNCADDRHPLRTLPSHQPADVPTRRRPAQSGACQAGGSASL